MKTLILVAFALFGMAQLAACDDGASSGNNGSTVIVPDDECPRDDGQPCK